MEMDENMLVWDLMILYLKYQSSQWDPWDCMLSTSFEKSGVLSAVAMRSSCFVCSSLSAALCLFLMNDSLENKDSQAYELPNITRSRHPTWLKWEYFSITSGDDQNDNPSSDNWAFIAESAEKSQISSSTSHCFRLGMNAQSCSLHKSPAFKHGVVTISISALISLHALKRLLNSVINFDMKLVASWLSISSGCSMLSRYVFSVLKWACSPGEIPAKQLQDNFTHIYNAGTQYNELVYTIHTFN